MNFVEESITFEKKLSNSWMSESMTELEVRYFSNLSELSGFLLLAGGTSKQAGVFPLEEQPGTLQLRHSSASMGKPQSGNILLWENLITQGFPIGGM